MQLSTSGEILVPGRSIYAVLMDGAVLYCRLLDDASHSAGLSSMQALSAVSAIFKVKYQMLQSHRQLSQQWLLSPAPGKKKTGQNAVFVRELSWRLTDAATCS
jgi:hypothetical protein